MGRNVQLSSHNAPALQLASALTLRIPESLAGSQPCLREGGLEPAHPSGELRDFEHARQKGRSH